jgi:hypothetical protein
MSQDTTTKQIEIDITLDDLIAFNRFAAKQSPRVKQGYRLAFIAVPVALIIVALILFKSLPTIVPVAIVFILAWIFAYPRFYWQLFDNNVKYLISQGKNKGIVGKHMIEISEKGLCETTEVNQSIVVWSGLERIEQNEQYVFAFVNPMMAHIIPIRAFADAKQAIEFFSTMKVYFNQAKAEEVTTLPK